MSKKVIEEVEGEVEKAKKQVRGKRIKVKKKKKNVESKLLISLEPISGTRDFLPQDMRYRSWMTQKWHDTSNVFGFEEYDAPILESTKLYTTKSGDEICSQMYNFKDKSDQEIALRPEMTPTLARLIMKAGNALLFPAKWYSVPQCWRWETTTRGRKREFYQWNMDILGMPGIQSEAEIIASIIYYLESLTLGSEDCAIRVSSRKILDSYLKSLNLPQPNDSEEMFGDVDMFAEICSVIDKVDKLPRSAIIELLEEKTLNENQVNSVMAYVDSKGTDDLYKLAGDENEAMRKSIKEVEDLLTLLDEGYGYKDWMVFDPSIVRGLAYYTGVVFEAFPRKGIKRAIAGGGRYDTLLSAFGCDRNVPAVGYGLGDVVVMEVLKDLKKLPRLERVVDDFVLPFSPKFNGEAVKIAMMLRKKGRRVEVAMKKYRKIKQAFSVADRCGAERVIFVAPEEFEKGMVKVKNLRSNDEETKEREVLISDL